MIPVRVELRDFLSHRCNGGEPTVFDFDGSRLWSISGDNGAGKSAIFDAITYTLFGRHRGGQQRAERLICRGAPSCEAAFEFRVNGDLYRVRRTVGHKGQPQREAAWFDPKAEDWRPIPDTNRQEPFDAWVREKLGLSYETFIASVLLLQGESDELILAKPKQRFEILSTLLELVPFKRLERAATERKTTAASKVKAFEEQLSGMSPVAKKELTEAKDKLKAAETGWEDAEKSLRGASLAASEAERFQGLKDDLSEAERELGQAKALLGDAQRIRREYREWSEIAEALPWIENAIIDIEAAVEAKQASETAEHEAGQLDVTKLRRQVREAKEEETATRGRARTLRDEAKEANEAIPLLSAVVDRRKDLEKRSAQLNRAGTSAKRQKELRAADKELKGARDQESTARRAHSRASEARGRAEAALDKSEKELKARREAKEEGTCSRCGQPVTAEHIKFEIAEARKAVAQAREKKRQADEALQQATRKLERAVEARERAEGRQQGAAEGLRVAKEAEGEAAEAQKAVERARRDAKTLPFGVARPVLGAANAVKAKAGLTRHKQGSAKIDQELSRADAAEEKARELREKTEEAATKAEQRRQELKAEAKRLGQESKGKQGQAEVRLAEVKAGWRRQALAGDRGLIRELERRQRQLEGVEDEHESLKEAEAGKVSYANNVKRLGSEIKKIKPEHQITVKRAKKAAEHAEVKLDGQKAAENKAREAVTVLEQRKRERAKLERRVREVGREKKLAGRLADLLGRSGLQAYLLDVATGGIEQLANETLRRISGGHLQVQVRRETVRNEEQVVIRALDVDSEGDPLDVEFLSGSEKFRTSVALAAAIGQYTAGSERVNSLIIDEGFGNLDTQGRQEMIDELHRLADLMERVIVVSHQDDFHDRALFPTGYLLSKAPGGGTEVERLA